MVDVFANYLNYRYIYCFLTFEKVSTLQLKSNKQQGSTKYRAVQEDLQSSKTQVRIGKIRTEAIMANMVDNNNNNDNNDNFDDNDNDTCIPANMKQYLAAMTGIQGVSSSE